MQLGSWWNKLGDGKEECLWRGPRGKGKSCRILSKDCGARKSKELEMTPIELTVSLIMAETIWCMLSTIDIVAAEMGQVLDP